MKRILFACLCVCVFTGMMYAQIPQAMKYKAIAKDEWGIALPSKDVTLQFTILQNEIAIYRELHYTTTNKFGLMDVNIGEGEVSLGYFDQIDWGDGIYSLKIELDPKGGTDFRIEGSDRLLSVPFALYAANAGEGNNADPDPQNELITDFYLSGTMLYIIEGNQTIFVDLLSLQDGYEDADPDPSNELQDLSLIGNLLGISQGSTVDLGTLPDLVEDADADPLNEIQLLSLTGNLLEISGGNSITLPVAAFPDGTFYYADRDADGFGDPFRALWLPQEVSPSAGYTTSAADCDDEDANVNPDAAEVNDRLDNDCDGEIDEDIFNEINVGEARYLDFSYVVGVACGYPAETLDALTYAAVSPVLFSMYPLCGECIEVTGPEGTATFKIVDKIGSVENYTFGLKDLDLSYEGFDLIGDPSLGLIPISWTIVPCVADVDADGD